MFENRTFQIRMVKDRPAITSPNTQRKVEETTAEIVKAGIQCGITLIIAYKAADTISKIAIAKFA